MKKISKQSNKKRPTAPGSLQETEERLSVAITDKFRQDSETKYDISSYPVDIIPENPIKTGNLIIKNYEDGRNYKSAFSTDENGNYVLGDAEEVHPTVNYETVPNSTALSAVKSKDHVLFTGTVLIPGEPDCDYGNGEEPLTVQKVAGIAHSFLDYRIVDKEHNYFNTGEEIGKPVESYLLDEPRTMKNIAGEEREYPEGTWIVKSKITDPDTMKKALKGEVAYSVTALEEDTAKALQSSTKSRVLIKDIKNPVGFTVTLTENPCVDNSCSAKSDPAAAMKSNDKSIVEKARDLLNNLLDGDEPMTKDENKSEKSEEYVTKSDFDNFKTEVMNAIKDKKEPDKSEKKEENKEEPSEKSGPPHKEQDGSKALKNHDNGEKEVSFKSMEYYMGRTPKGRPIKKEE